MPIFNEFEFLSSDNKTNIYVREYVPDGEIKGQVQIVHGIAEHCDRYDEFMQFLAKNGYAAAAHDQLGHGRSVLSEEERGFFAEENGWNTANDDIKKLHEIQSEKYPGKFSALFGHSMGSFQSRTYLIRYPDDFDAAVLCGTGQQGVFMVSIGELLAKGDCIKSGPKHRSEALQNLAFGSYNKKFKPERTEYDWICSDEKVVDEYIADPYCGNISTVGLFADMMHGIKFIGNKNNIEKMNKDLPVLFIAGTDDPVGDYGKGVKKVSEMFKEAGVKDVRVKLYEGDRHEILNEKDKATVYKNVLLWINKHNS